MVSSQCVLLSSLVSVRTRSGYVGEGGGGWVRHGLIDTTKRSTTTRLRQLETRTNSWDLKCQVCTRQILVASVTQMIWNLVRDDVFSRA